MKTTMQEIKDLKLSEPKHRKLFFNWMGRSGFLAYAEASFILCAWDYVFNPDDAKAGAFAKVFLRDGSPLQINLGGTHRNTAISMLGAHDITLKSFGSDKLSHTVTNFKKQTGLRNGGAANYNITTKFIEYIEAHRYREKTALAVQQIGQSGSLPKEKATSYAVDDAVYELKPYWGAEGLKTLGIAA